MRSTVLLATAALLASAHAQLVPFLTHDTNARWILTPTTLLAYNYRLLRATETGNDAVILSDVIGTNSEINIFAGFARGVSTVSTRLETSALNTTVLAPLNKAIQALPRKPWEDPQDYAKLGASAYHGDEGEDRAQRNMRRFAEAHVVPESPWEEGVKVETMGGGNVWWEKKDGKVVVMPGEVEVKKVAQKVANGEVWVIDGVLNYAQ